MSTSTVADHVSLSTTETKELQIGSRTWQVQGNPQDRYFRDAQVHANGLANLLNLAGRRVRPDATILDIGANIGLAAIGLSALVPDGRVIAFEPCPQTAHHLAANLAANNIGNCTVVAAALGSEAGTARFAVPATFSAGSHIMQDAEASHSPVTLEVPVFALDEWLEDAGIPRVDFVKLDVEGYEPFALDGARRVIARDRPPIFMEFNSWTLLAFGDINPIAFVRRLWQSFEVLTPLPDGSVRELNNPLSFAHDNLVRHRCVEDVLLELREAAVVPTLQEMRTH